MGWDNANLIATVGAIFLGLGLAYYFAVIVHSWFRGATSPADPWDARTLEWSIGVPPPEHNFDVIPTVQARDDFWESKQDRSIAITGARRTPSLRIETDGIHMPSQSWFPLTTAGAIMLSALCFANHLLGFAAMGLMFVFVSVLLWSFEGPGGYHIRPNARP